MSSRRSHYRCLRTTTRRQHSGCRPPSTSPSRRTTTTTLTEEQLQSCIGPDDAAICQRGFATARRRDSCLATLYYHTPDTALATCEMNTIQLPRIEQARNLGHGRWLILSRGDAFNFRLLPAGPGESTPHGSISLLPGCRACILTLECGTKLESDNLHIKADAASCNATGARRLELEISAPLANLFSYVPLDKELPDLATLSAQRAHLFKEVQARLPLPQDAPQAMSPEAFKTLTEPIAANSAATLFFRWRLRPTWQSGGATS